MALVERRTGYWIRARATARLASVSLRAQIRIVTGGSVWLLWIRATARARVADAGIVTLVERRANNRVRAGAASRLTGVGLGALVCIVAIRPVGLVRVSAITRRRLADADVVTLV